MTRLIAAVQRANNDERGHVEVGVPALVAGIAAIVLAIGAAAITLLTAATVASVAPARRAASVPPAEGLKAE